MPETRPTGRGAETVEIMPTVLDCRHPFTPGRVSIGTDSREPGGQRMRTIYCWECREVTYRTL